jgi:hypothetical protein
MKQTERLALDAGLTGVSLISVTCPLKTASVFQKDSQGAPELIQEQASTVAGKIKIV